MKIKTSKTPHSSTQISFYTVNDAPSVPDFKGEKNEISVVYGAKGAAATTIYCGLGKISGLTPSVLCSAAATGIRKALELKRREISLIAPEIAAARDLWPFALEGALLGAYRFTKYKSDKGVSIDSLEMTGKTVSAHAAGHVQVQCDAVCGVRDLVNDNAHVVYPAYFANEAAAVAKKYRMKCVILDEKDIDKKGLGLLKAVGQGSPYPPRLVMLEYRGALESKDMTAIVGKGITFDSGGQNLKPTGSIETMRCDMAGAATVLGVMKVIGEYRPKINVVGVCCLAHNAIGRNAFFPGDVYKSYSGKTVEINSTDAEGRLVLADAISYCKDIYNPARIIDLATLTGGIITALGTTVAGLFSNDKKLEAALFESGERTNERLWPFPIYDEHADSLKSDIADLRNLSKKKKGWASSITGAAFIREFAGPQAWAHIDIAGTAFNEDGESAEIPLGATGFGVRLLADYLMGL
jgi:leucyl aminopeptidase